MMLVDNVCHCFSPLSYSTSLVQIILSMISILLGVLSCCLWRACILLGSYFNRPLTDYEAAWYCKDQISQSPIGNENFNTRKG